MSNPSSCATPSGDESRAGKYLLFRLGREEYGVAVLKVREIVEYQEPVAVPRTPVFVKGVINLRGKVIPVMDLRERFGLPPGHDIVRASIIIVQAQDSTPPVFVGIVVDEVLEVVDIGSSEIEDTPDFGHDLDNSYIIGVAKAQSRVRILLNTEKALNLKPRDSSAGVECLTN